MEYLAQIHPENDPLNLWNKPTMTWLDEVKWNSEGLVPAIAQEAGTKKVLMVAWMNRDSLRLSVESGEAVYWSRSRNRLWHKGEESGHIQKLLEIRIDCDEDVLLLCVEQVGGIACHTGRNSCFFRKLQDGKWETDEGVIKNPVEIYRK